jgi:hypothetical protein
MRQLVRDMSIVSEIQDPFSSVTTEDNFYTNFDGLFHLSVRNIIVILVVVCSLHVMFTRVSQNEHEHYYWEMGC